MQITSRSIRASYSHLIIALYVLISTLQNINLVWKSTLWSKKTRYFDHTYFFGTTKITLLALQGGSYLLVVLSTKYQGTCWYDRTKGIPAWYVPGTFCTISTCCRHVLVHAITLQVILTLTNTISNPYI